MPTAKVSYTSKLKRNTWFKDGLLQEASQSFWQPYTGSSSDAIIYQRTDTSCSTGHTVVFDYSGKLTGKGYRGDDYTYGRGEVKRKFSGILAVEQFSHFVDNGSAFDGCDIDDLSSTAHTDSRGKLADLLIRHKDQSIFDVLQGCTGKPMSHIYYLNNTFEYNDLIYIENAIKKGTGLVKANANGIVSTDKATRRAPLSPWKTEGKKKLNVTVVDTYMATKLKADPKYQTIIINADVRGNNNRALDMTIGKLGQVVYVEAPAFFGTTEGEGVFDIISDSTIEYAGLRMYATDDTGAIYWEGQDKFYAAEDAIAAGTAGAGEKIYSRGLLLGGGAGQSAWGKMPEYTMADPSGGHEFVTETAVKYWYNAQKTHLTIENGTKYQGRVDDIDYGVIAVDMLHA